jgi:hypothetical protein
MKPKTFHLVLFIGLALSGGLAYGQGSLGAGPKKPRTLEDYKPGTLKQIVVENAKSDGLSPFRVRVTYTARVRPISTTSNGALHDWAQCCAGNPDHYKGYVREMQFVENGAAYWLAVANELIADLQKEVKVGEAVDLFLIRLSAPVTKGKRGSVLLVERLQRAANGDDVKEQLDWIISNLPSYSQKDLKVEVNGRCQVEITDASNTVSVSKAVGFLPLSDLDSSKVVVEPERVMLDMWVLRLHTIAGKRSIRFMLYQRGPAEGGQASRYSLIFRDREHAEAVAERFRRAINICAGARLAPVD